ncbi:MAG: ABC transporter ATP-binding protein [Firmicutes bacterium]|nr:ABC transporter ATP-binding protein [Bacillota bacterium]
MRLERRTEAERRMEADRAHGGPAPTEPALALAGVTKAYRRGAQPVLCRVDLVLRPGEWAFLTGPSGAGKSTVLKLFYGAVRPDEGTVRVLGMDVARVPPHRVRRHMGLVFQSFELLPQKTVLENVAYGAEILGFPPREAAAAARRMLAAVGLEGLAGRFPWELSGGEQQRVGIARALIHRPPIVLADEPTGNLDVDTARRVFEIFRAVHQEWQPTMLIATHSRDLLEWAEARVIRVEGGRLTEDTAASRRGAGKEAALP